MEASSEKRTCARHGEYHETVREYPHTNKKIASPCPDCFRESMQAESRQDALEIAREAKRRVGEGVLKRAGIPKRFLNKTLSNYIADGEQQRRALGLVTDYVENLAQRRSDGSSLVFCGTTGTGKTHLACAIGNEAIKQNYSVMFCSVREAVNRVKETWSRKSDSTEAEVVKDFVGFDLLILDEVGVQFDSDSERLIMFDIINGRYQDVKPTILISNFALDSETSPSVRKVLGDRVIDRMRENGGKVINFNWQSYRAG